MKKRADGRYAKSVTLNGKRVYFYSTEQTERRAERDITHQIAVFEEKDTNNTAFDKIAEKWLCSERESKEHNTLKAYAPCCRAATEYFGSATISSIKPKDIQKYADSLSRQAYSRSTIKNRILVVSLIFKYAVVNGLADGNPCQFVTVSAKKPKKKREPPTDEECRIIMSEAGTDDFSLLMAFILCTGLRRGEACCITYGDIRNKTVTVNKTAEWIGNRMTVKNHPKTAAGVREVPVPDSILRLIGKGKQTELVLTDAGKPWTNDRLSRSTIEYQRRTGVTTTPHALRHKYATILFYSGVSVKTAQMLLGHANISTTMDIYTHLESGKENYAERILGSIDKFG